MIDPNNNKYEIVTNEIINFINSGNNIEAQKKFNSFLNDILIVNRYNKDTWSELFTLPVYALARVICEKNVAPEYLEILHKKISSSSENVNEIFYFVDSEIKFNYWTASDPRTYEYTLGLVKKYPNNAEFIHDLGHIEIFKKNHDAGKHFYEQAFKLNPNNQTFFKSCYTLDFNYINELIESERFADAEDYTNNIINRKTYVQDLLIGNWLLSMLYRIKDHKLIRTTLENKEKEIENSIEKERIKAIEMIGIFTAIMAFIFSSVSLFRNSSPFKENFFIEIVLGIFLLLFPITISMIFQNKEKSFLKDIRFYSIVVLAISLVLIYYFNRN